MILYFSATGNCKYVALRLADALEQEAVSIVDCIRCGTYSFGSDIIGIICPAYDWGLPSIVDEFLKRASFNAKYLFFVSTYGTTPGASDYMARKAIRNASINAFYSVRMPDTWTPIFDLSTPAKVAAFTRTTESEIDGIICKIRDRYTNTHMSPRLPAFIAMPTAQFIYNTTVRKTRHFHVEESCIGCGLCASKCPIGAINMENKRPVWVKDKCVMCLGCLHRCPKFAIQYGKMTKRHGQYTNPNVKL